MVTPINSSLGKKHSLNQGDELRRAIVRKPGMNFSSGLTTSDLDTPDLNTTLQQHLSYCRALETCGLQLTVLDADMDFPDGTFVEDTAILTKEVAILTRPGAPSRQGEVILIQPILAESFDYLEQIASPGCVEGGDICDVSGHFFIGISQRTNENGASQLSTILQRYGFTSSTIDIRGIPGVLHLKSGLAWLGDDTIVVDERLKDQPGFSRYRKLVLSIKEAYAANCIRIKQHVLIAKGFPSLESLLLDENYSIVQLDVSEFRKMDGGLSCLSLRY